MTHKDAKMPLFKAVKKISILCSCYFALHASPIWAQTTAPDTPAGRTLAAMLDAFNSGDRERMDAYYKKYQPSVSVDSQMQFRSRTGGFELLEIQKSEPLHIEFLVKERA